MDLDSGESAGADRMADTESAAELLQVVRHWVAAMIGNDADNIGRYMADDGILIGSDGRTIDKATFLGVIESGELSHDTMESEDVKIRVYDNAAVVTASGVSAGRFRGHPFREVERAIQHVCPRGAKVALCVNSPVTARDA